MRKWLRKRSRTRSWARTLDAANFWFADQADTEEALRVYLLLESGGYALDQLIDMAGAPGVDPKAAVQDEKVLTAALKSREAAFPAWMFAAHALVALEWRRALLSGSVDLAQLHDHNVRLLAHYCPLPPAQATLINSEVRLAEETRLVEPGDSTPERALFAGALEALLGVRAYELAVLAQDMKWVPNDVWWRSSWSYAGGWYYTEVLGVPLEELG